MKLSAIRNASGLQVADVFVKTRIAWHSTLRPRSAEQDQSVALFVVLSGLSPTSSAGGSTESAAGQARKDDRLILSACRLLYAMAPCPRALDGRLDVAEVEKQPPPVRVHVNLLNGHWSLVSGHWSADAAAAAVEHAREQP